MCIRDRGREKKREKRQKKRKETRNRDGRNVIAQGYQNTADTNSPKKICLKFAYNLETFPY